MQKQIIELIYLLKLFLDDIKIEEWTLIMEKLCQVPYI